MTARNKIEVSSEQVLALYFTERRPQERRNPRDKPPPQMKLRVKDISHKRCANR